MYSIPVLSKINRHSEPCGFAYWVSDNGAWASEFGWWNPNEKPSEKDWKGLIENMTAAKAAIDSIKLEIESIRSERNNELDAWFKHHDVATFVDVEKAGLLNEFNKFDKQESRIASYAKISQLEAILQEVQEFVDIVEPYVQSRVEKGYISLFNPAARASKRACGRAYLSVSQLKMIPGYQISRPIKKSR